LKDLDLFTVEDVNTVINIIDNLGSVNAVNDAVTVESIEDLDLEALASSLHGITDPIGQLQSWLYDVLQELTSWISDTVNQIFQSFWDTVIKPFLDGLSSLVENIWSYIQQIPGVFTDLVSWIKDQVNSIWAWIQENLVTPLGNAIQSFIDLVSSGIETITSFFTETLPSYITQIPSMIQEAISGAWDWIQTYIITPLTNVFDTLSKWISDAITAITDFFTKTLPAYMEQIPSMIQEAISGAWSWIQANIIDPLTKTFQTLLGLAQQGLNMLTSFFTETLPSYIAGIPSMIQEAISDAWSWIESNIITPLSNAVQSLIDLVSSGIETITSFFTETLPGLISQIPNMIQEALTQSLAGIAQWIQDNIIAPLGKNIQAIIDVVTKGINTIKNYIEEIGESLLELPSKALEGMKVVGMTLWEYITSLGKQLTTGFQLVGQYLEQVGKHLSQVGVVLTGFTNAVLKFPEWFENNLVKPFLEGLGKLMEAYFAPLKWFSDTLQEGIKRWQELFRDPVSFYKDYIVGPVIKWTKDVVSQILLILDKLEDYAYEIAKKFVKKGEGLVVEPLSRLFESMITSITENYKKLMEGEIKLHEFIIEYLKSIIPATLEIAGMLEGLRFIGKEINSFVERLQQLPTMLIAVAGVAEGEAFETLANIAEKGAWNIAYNVPFSVAFWMAQPLQTPIEYAFRYQLRNMLPIALPTVTQIRDIIRRLSLIEGFEDKYKELITYIALRGYSDPVLEYMYDLGEKYFIKIKDRFGKDRTIPLSLLWDLPSRSDLVRMLQRDVFQSPMEWAQFIRVHGLNEHLGKMYYMMSFEYPSFEKLWQFFVRGISGMLWYEPPDFIKDWFKQDAEWLGAGVPVEPKKLNYDYKALFKAIPFYLKWIQKSNFSWFRKDTKLRYGNIEINIDFDWTADSWMLWDVAADLPGKIDARWMAKWALFDHISNMTGVPPVKKGATLTTYPETPFVDLVTKVVENQVKSDIYMDLRAFTRLLVANGLHPAWVPITAVAEAINALADERTLLRTGFINLFKEGFWNYTTIDKLLDGFFTASFAVEYFDPAEKKWKAGAINVPVKFLPAERRLLELRALMDRALDILRDLVRELTRSYAEHVIIAREDYLKELEDGINRTNTWFAKTIKEITGKELKLVVDMDYWSTYTKVLDIYRDLYVIRRIRYWVGRLLTWSFYRLAYEYVTLEDVKKLLGIIKDVAKLTDNEVGALESIMEVFVGIAKREYIPTPSQLATIAEIVPEATKYIDEVFEKRYVPAEWRSIWAKYIMVKPIKNEVNGLLTAYRRAKEYGVPLNNLEQEVLSLAKEVGYTDKELNIIALRIRLEQLIDEVREMRRAYLPTPSMLATLSEYIEIPAEMIQKVLEERRVPVEWRDLWLKYISIRPYADDIRYLLNAYLKVKRYGVELPTEIENRVRQLLEAFGITKTELELRELAIMLETLRETLPTLSQLGSMAEYIEIPSEFVKKVLEARRVSKEYADLWIKYISVRTIASEVNEVVSQYRRLYEYFTVPQEFVDKVRQIMLQGGWTQRELEIFNVALQLRKAYRIMAYMIPTIRQFVTDAYYMPDWEKLFDDLLKARGIDVAKYQRQVEYYKKLIRNRMVWRQISWYRSQLVYAYANGVIDKNTLRQKLEKLKQYGLSDQEIELILDGAELNRLTTIKIYGPRQT